MEALKQKYSGMLTLTTEAFLEVFGKFDKDGNGYIEKEELDDLMVAMLETNVKSNEIDPAMISAAKQEILSIADTNFDGRIDMSELAALLMPKECFLAQFQSKIQLTSTDFMKIWHQYDINWNGYIDGGEIKAFFFDLLRETPAASSPQHLEDFVNSTLDLFDKDKDGRFAFNELSQILPVVDNFLKKVSTDKLSEEEFNSVYDHYDGDGNGYIEGVELSAFVKDVTEINDGMFNMSELDSVVKTILALFDFNKDGKLNKSELRMILCGKSGNSCK